MTQSSFSQQSQCAMSDEEDIIKFFISSSLKQLEQTLIFAA